MTVFPFLHGNTSRTGKSTMFNTVGYLRPGLMGVAHSHIPDPHWADILTPQHQRSDGRTERPPCAHDPNQWGFTEGCPVAIRSSRSFFPERRSNSAHHCPPSVTPL